MRPCGPGNLADINVAVRVHRKTVRRQELAQLGPRRRVAEAPEQLALAIDDADPRSEIGNAAADRGSRADFADIENRLTAVRHTETARAMQVLPLRLELTVAVEHLDAMVLAVGDIDPAISVTADVMDDVELAFTA